MAAAAAAEAAATVSVCWEGVAARDERDGTNIDAGPARRIVPTPVPRSRPHSLRIADCDPSVCRRMRAVVNANGQLPHSHTQFPFFSEVGTKCCLIIIIFFLCSVFFIVDFGTRTSLPVVFFLQFFFVLLFLFIGVFCLLYLFC